MKISELITELNWWMGEEGDLPVEAFDRREEAGVNPRLGAWIDPDHPEKSVLYLN